MPVETSSDKTFFDWLTEILTWVISHPDVIALACIGGFIPALIWMWFWLREDKHPEPWQYITLVFIMGIVMVPIVIPFQVAVLKYYHLLPFVLPIFIYFLWAALEEVFKYAAAYFAALKSPVNDEPVDPIIYMIVAALGFAALENTLFLVDPISNKLVVDSVVIANLRFVGATLLHIVTSATVGIFLAFSFYKTKKEKITYLILGLILATLLHFVFNLAILSSSNVGGIIVALFIAWMGAMVLVFMFEIIKRYQ
ncbi:MAG: PrsW family glutamic-type intramembrane protease [Candidatus Paceibacterota bacterium]